MRLLAFALLAVTASAQAQLTPDAEGKIADIAAKVLHDTGVPSASIGIAQNGHIVYTGAFGMASIQPKKPAEPTMAYPIGSISKQFTATAVLLLQQDGKLSIDDPVSKYFPELTRAHDITLRNLMTMTSGYEDFAPQDYIIPAWRTATDPLATVHTWAEKPLDLEPGTDWQYSNTNYVLLALIVQKVSGKPFYQVLRERVLTPLRLEGVFNTYTESQKLRVTGYVSNAMAPPRVLPLEAPGWYFGDGDLAMPASTLLAWDIGMMNQSLLSAASYKMMETPFVLKDGLQTTYGLGIRVYSTGSHLEFQHGGEVGGYVSENRVYPNERVAIVVLTNEVASEAAAKIASAIEPLVLPPEADAATAPDDFAGRLGAILTGLQIGSIDRSLLTSDANAYFDKATLADFEMSLAVLGTVTAVERTSSVLRGGLKIGRYRVTFSKGTTLIVSLGVTQEGKIEQLLVTGKE